MPGKAVQHSKSSLGALTLGAIGVVYGDIGTSVLYSVKEVFGSGHVPFTQANVYGILSSPVLDTDFHRVAQYVVLVLRADNHGEGGLVAMLALASQAVKEQPTLAPGAADGGYFWCLLVLWRWRHHPGHYGVGGGGGPGGGVSRVERGGHSAHLAHLAGPVCGAKTRHGQA